MAENYKYTVCTRCFTYNQKQYILDALNGFVMQETSFPVVSVIVDDASTDGEQEVILDFFNKNFDTQVSEVAYKEDAEFGSIYYAQHKVNKNCYFAIVLLKENYYSQKKSKFPYIARWQDNAKYIALCEGDDYWTDSLKLQKQVSILEKHPELVICSHNFVRYFEDSHSFEDNLYYSDLFPNESSYSSLEYCLDSYFDRWWTQPLTCVFRNGEYLKRIPSMKYKFFRDDIHYYYVLKEGKGILLKDSMGVYRVQNGGVWSGTTQLQRYERGAYNAFNIYQVERDERAFKRINREELRFLETAFNEHSYILVLKKLRSFKRIAPKVHFKAVMTDFSIWLRNKIKRKMNIVSH